MSVCSSQRSARPYLLPGVRPPVTANLQGATFRFGFPSRCKPSFSYIYVQARANCFQPLRAKSGTGTQNCEQCVEDGGEKRNRCRRAGRWNLIFKELKARANQQLTNRRVSDRRTAESRRSDLYPRRSDRGDSESGRKRYASALTGTIEAELK